MERTIRWGFDCQYWFVQKWVEQLYSINLGDDDDDGEEGSDGGSSAEGSEKPRAEPTKYDYFMHFLTVPWKLMFATIPPTDYW